MEFKDKFVAFVDILGFKQMVEAAENGEGRGLAELRELQADLGHAHGAASIRKHGPRICPASPRIAQDLDFQATQISDCVVVSAEVSPAGAIALVNHCWGAAITLLTKGVLVRGYITRGRIFHDGYDVIGTGYQSAYDRERGVTAFRRNADERGTPFVEVDRAVCEYVDQQGDACVREMFGRSVKHDGEVTALFPFKRLNHSFSIGGYGRPHFDPEREKQSNDTVRKNLHLLKDRLLRYVQPDDEQAMVKVRHYLHALDGQLKQCDRTDELIDKLAGPARPTMRPRP